MDRKLPIFRQSPQDCSSPRWHDANILQPPSQVNERASFTAGDPVQHPGEEIRRAEIAAVQRKPCGAVI
ncbi:hypothetical protein CO667_05140 [Rhizobium sp. L43]|nr:hypothetical protein CO667_05140 [Rhizobium sp. L43]